MQKVERWPKHCKNRCEMRHTQENTEKNDAKWRAEHVFGQCSPPVVAFFARKHRKYRRENKTQVQFRASKVPKLEFQHMPAKKSTHPARRQTHVLPPTTTTTTTATTTTTCIRLLLLPLVLRLRLRRPLLLLLLLQLRLV